jgi:hypothetical protein
MAKLEMAHAEKERLGLDWREYVALKTQDGQGDDLGLIS